MFSKKKFLAALALSASGYLLLMPMTLAQTVMLTGSAVTNAIQTKAPIQPVLSNQSQANRTTGGTTVVPVHNAAVSHPLRAAARAAAGAQTDHGLQKQYPLMDRRSVYSPQYSQSASRSSYQQPAGRQPYYSSTQSQPRTAAVQDNRTYFQKHPMVKKATIGAGVGAGVGAATGLLTGRGILHGAVAGGATGAGVGVIRSSQIMKRHPIARDVATGAVSGLGLGWAGGWDPATKYRTAAVGAALGLGVGLWKHLN